MNIQGAINSIRQDLLNLANYIAENPPTGGDNSQRINCFITDSIDFFALKGPSYTTLNPQANNFVN